MEVSERNPLVLKTKSWEQGALSVSGAYTQGRKAKTRVSRENPLTST